MPVLVSWIGDGETEVREGMVQAKMVVFRRYFKLLFFKCVYLFLAVLGLCCCSGCPLDVVLGLLIAVLLLLWSMGPRAHMGSAVVPPGL